MPLAGEHLDPATLAGSTAGRSAATVDALRRRRRKGIDLEMLAAEAALLWCHRNPHRAGVEGGSLFVAAFRTAYAQWAGWPRP